MPSYKNWSCVLTLHVRAEHFQHLHLHSTHYNTSYRGTCTLRPNTLAMLPTDVLMHLWQMMGPWMTCVRHLQCFFYTCVGLSLTGGDKTTPPAPCNKTDPASKDTPVTGEDPLMDTEKISYQLMRFPLMLWIQGSNLILQMICFYLTF